MSTFSKATYLAANYSQFRPHYPPSFYKLLSQYLGHKVKRAVDIGCGTGVLLYPLLDMSDRVVGTDALAVMVERANALKQERLAPQDATRISFEVADVTNWQDTNVDLITVAQALHWFNIPKFFHQAYESLAPGGVLAYYYYVDPVIKGVPHAKEANDLYNRYVYGDNTIGPFWEQPGRSILAGMCRDVNKQISPKEFTRVEEHQYEAAKREPNDKDLVMIRSGVVIDDLLNYIRTYLGYHNFADATGKGEEIMTQFADDLHKLGWTNDTKFDLVWNTGYTFMTKAD